MRSPFVFGEVVESDAYSIDAITLVGSTAYFIGNTWVSVPSGRQ